MIVHNETVGFEIDHLRMLVHTRIPFSVFYAAGVQLPHGMNPTGVVDRRVAEIVMKHSVEGVLALTKTWTAVRKQIAKNNRKRFGP
jgi:hypothetical protein